MKSKKKTGKKSKFPYLGSRAEIHWSDGIGVRIGKKGFILSFAQFNPNEQSYYIIWETVIPPEIAQAFSKALSDAIKDFKKIKVT